MAGDVVHPAFGAFKKDDSGDGIQILGFHGSVMAMCQCGAPFMIPVIPGQHAGAQCFTCNRTHRVAKIEYHEPPLPLDDAGKVVVDRIKPAQLKIYFDTKKPLVELAPGALKV